MRAYAGEIEEDRLELTERAIVNGERVEKELNGFIDTIARKNGDDLGRGAANASEARYRDRSERLAQETRERNRWGWIAHHESQRRTHLQIALEHRAASRALRGVA